jgi:ribosomal protein L40E
MTSITRVGKIRFHRLEIGGEKKKDYVEFELEISGQKMRIFGNSKDAHGLGMFFYETKCSYCGTENRENASYCRKCGRELIRRVDEDKNVTVTIST